MNDVYSPTTGEHIKTDIPSDWMGRAGVPAPTYDPQTASAFWRGDSWEVVQAQPPMLPVPPSCTRRQGLLALLSSGIRRADIEAKIAEIEDAAAREEALIEYEAATWDRENEFLQGMWHSLGGTPEQLDDLFRLAATL